LAEQTAKPKEEEAPIQELAFDPDNIREKVL